MSSKDEEQIKAFLIRVAMAHPAGDDHSRQMYIDANEALAALNRLTTTPTGKDSRNDQA